MEEMEKRSRRRTRDLVTQAASQGLSENEIGCARISMMARSTNAPCRAGYRCARPTPSICSHSACNARPVHTLGQSRDFDRGPATSLYSDERTSSDPVGMLKPANGRHQHPGLRSQSCEEVSSARRPRNDLAHWTKPFSLSAKTG